MAHFNQAFDITMKHEGGYSNNPNDVGGETYRGISRVYNPNWEGWEFVDSSKRAGLRIDDAFLEPAVRAFYKQRYWDPNRLDNMPQPIAEEVFDTGVNLGIGRAAKFLQRALNALNRNQLLYDDLVEDGTIGPKTLNALNVLTNADQWLLLKILNVLQGCHYLENMRKSPSQEVFARGWFSRVTIEKE